MGASLLFTAACGEQFNASMGSQTASDGGGTGAQGGAAGQGGTAAHGGEGGAPPAGGGGHGADGGAGGQGGAPPSCTVASDCPDPMNECLLTICKDGACNYNPIAAGLAVTQQIPGNCRKEVCDGSGGLAYLLDPKDIEDDGNVCTTDGCDDELPSHTVDEGAACADGGQVCSSRGQCVTCNTATDCTADATCVDHVCVSASCNDNQKNGGESDVDCGGPDCLPCPEGGACQTAGDCVTGVCNGSECQPPSCDDGVANGSESDVDCGAEGCGACAIGKKCFDNGDCTTMKCVAGVCVPSCSDGFKNGSESDIDCGGTCSPCGNGKKCSHGYDCASYICLLNKCL